MVISTERLPPICHMKNDSTILTGSQVRRCRKTNTNTNTGLSPIVALTPKHILHHELVFYSVSNDQFFANTPLNVACSNIPILKYG